MIFIRSIISLLLCLMCFNSNSQCSKLYYNPQDSLTYADSLFTEMANCVHFTLNGKNRTEYTFIAGKMRKVVSYHENNTVEFSFDIEENGQIANDSMITYHDNGGVAKIGYYEKGVETEYKFFDIKGRLLEEKKYIGENTSLELVPTFNGNIFRQTITAPNLMSSTYRLRDNGKIASIDTWVVTPHGISIGFNENGTPSYIETYVYGQRNGWCVYYTEEGDFKQRDYYIGGVLLETETVWH